MTKPDSILKSRDIILPTKVHLFKAMLVTYGYESWTVKKAECRRIDAFELWCWRRLLRVPWTARRSNQSILKEINPEYSLEGLMLKLKLQYFGHLMQRTDSFEKTLMLGKIEGGRRRGWQRMRWLDGTHHAPLSKELSWQEYWNGLPFPPSGDLPKPGTEIASEASALAGRFFTTKATWEDQHQGPSPCPAMRA